MSVSMTIWFANHAELGHQDEPLKDVQYCSGEYGLRCEASSEYEECEARAMEKFELIMLGLKASAQPHFEVYITDEDGDVVHSEFTCVNLPECSDQCSKL